MFWLMEVMVGSSGACPPPGMGAPTTGSEQAGSIAARASAMVGLIAPA